MRRLKRPPAAPPGARTRSIHIALRLNQIAHKMVQQNGVGVRVPAEMCSFALCRRGPVSFKLRSPDDYIVGGGFFGHFTILLASFAWAASE